MALEYLKFESEKLMGDYVVELFDDFIDPPQSPSEVARLPISLLPSLADGLDWRHNHTGDEWSHLEVYREVQIPCANEAGNGPAPCDILVLATLFDVNRGDTWVAHIIVELKNRPIRARDFGQLSRYLRAYRNCEDLVYPTGRIPEIVMGVLLGDGCTHESKALAETIPDVALLEWDRYGNTIWGMDAGINTSYASELDPRLGELSLIGAAK